jgi:hypothetical protein
MARSSTHRIVLFAGGALALLIIPIIGVLLGVGGFNWGAEDFLTMALVLAGVGVGLGIATSAEIPFPRRLVWLGIIGAILALSVHLSVGIVNTWPLAGS